MGVWPPEPVSSRRHNQYMNVVNRRGGTTDALGLLYCRYSRRRYRDRHGRSATNGRVKTRDTAGVLGPSRFAARSRWYRRFCGASVAERVFRVCSQTEGLSTPRESPGRTVLVDGCTDLRVARRLDGMKTARASIEFRLQRRSEFGFGFAGCREVLSVTPRIRHRNRGVPADFGSPDRVPTYWASH